MRWRSELSVSLFSASKLRAWTGVKQDCMLCEAGARRIVCIDCDASLTRSVTACRVCAAPNVQGVCGACLRDPPYFDAAIAAFEYTFPLDRMIQAFKFSANLSLVDFFADALAEKISASSDLPLPDLVVALPLAPKRLASRGFNQSALIAAKLGARLQRNVGHTAMLRIRETPPQTGLSRAERRKNIRGAFDVRAQNHESLAGKRVAIVDDVLTSGATLSEAAAALKHAGVVHVDAWVIARATFGKD
jgi:ComF family protein